MNNNGLIVYKENFITKIRNLFKRIFRKKEHLNQYEEKKFENNINYNTKDRFMNDIRVGRDNVVKVAKRAKLLKQVEENDKILNTLSIGELRDFERYYDTIIEDNKETIKKLQESS